MRFKYGLYSILVVLIIHFFLLINFGYERINQIDIFMHLAGGFSFGLIGLALVSYIKPYLKKTLPVWFMYLFIIGFVMIIGVAWEFHEFILDQTINIWYHLPITQASLADTMKDLANDWMGASFAFLFFQKDEKKRIKKK